MYAKVDYVGFFQRLRFRRSVIYVCECGRTIARFRQRKGEELMYAECYCGAPVDMQLIRNDYQECFRGGKGCRLTTPLRGSALEFKTGEELLNYGDSSNDTD